MIYWWGRNSKEMRRRAEEEKIHVPITKDIMKQSQEDCPLPHRICCGI